MLCNAVLVSAIQHESAIYIYPLPLEPFSHPFIPPSDCHRVSQSAPELHSSSPLALCFAHSTAYMSALLSHFIPPSPSPAVSTRIKLFKKHIYTKTSLRLRLVDLEHITVLGARKMDLGKRWQFSQDHIGN